MAPLGWAAQGNEVTAEQEVVAEESAPRTLMGVVRGRTTPASRKTETVQPLSRMSSGEAVRKELGY